MRHFHLWPTRLVMRALLFTTFAGAGALLAGTAADLKPPAGFQHWYLANSMLVTKEPNQFGLVSGLHLIYVNDAGFGRFKRGGAAPYPDGTVFVDDIREFSLVDGAYQQGARKAVPVMVKGQTLADVPISIGSLDPCFSCTERFEVVDVQAQSCRVYTAEELTGGLHVPPQPGGQP